MVLSIQREIPHHCVVSAGAMLLLMDFFIFFCGNSSMLHSQSWGLIVLKKQTLFLHLKVSHQPSRRFVSGVPILRTWDLTWPSAEYPSFFVCFWNNAVDRWNWKQHTAFGKGQGIKYSLTWNEAPTFYGTFTIIFPLLPCKVREHTTTFPHFSGDLDDILLISFMENSVWKIQLITCIRIQVNNLYMKCEQALRHLFYLFNITYLWLST